MPVYNSLHFLISSLILHFSTSVPPKGEIFKWKAKSWPQTIKNAPPMVPIIKQVNLEDMFDISCETNDPDAAVKLNFQKNQFAGKQDAVTKGNGRIRKKQGSQVFIVTSVMNSDSGKYSCSAVDKNGNKLQDLRKGRLLVINVSKKVKPDIIPDKEISIETYGTYPVNCKTKASGRLDKSLLKWYRRFSNGTKVKMDASSVIAAKEERKDSTFIDVETLVFKNFTSADVGEYVCERKVLGAQPTSRSLMVKLKPDVPPNVTVTKSNTRPKEGSSIKIICSATGSPKPKLVWKINGKERNRCTPKFSIQKASSHCVLDIGAVRLEEDNGEFICTAKNLKGEDSISVKIEVQVKPLLKVKYIKSVSAHSNEAIELFAEISRANPLATVTWYEQKCNVGDICDMKESAWRQVDKQQPDNSTQTMISHIVTPKVDVPYWYRYVAENRNGKANFTFKLTRDENEKQQFAITSNQAEDGVIDIYEEDKFSFTCYVDSQVYKSQTLKKGGTNLPSKISTEIQGVVIALKYSEEKAKFTDSGNYTCVAVSNSGVTRTRTIVVDVKKLIAPSIIGFKNTKIVAKKDGNSNYVIPCNSKGSPPPKVSWKFNGNYISDSTKSCEQRIPGIYRLPDNNLVICKVNFIKHAGMYECIVKNKVNTDNASMNLMIDAEPEIVNWIGNTMSVGLSKPVNLSCRAKANPPANVTWYKVEKQKHEVFRGTGMVESYLRIPEIDENDAGSYTCRAKNVHGNMSVSLDFIVTGAVIQKDGDKNVTIGVAVAAIILLILAGILMWWYKRRLKEKYALYLAPNDNFELDPDKSIFDQSNDLPYDMAWEFPRTRLQLIKTLGSGAFGEVWLAEAAGIHAFKPRDKSPAATKKRKSMQKSKRYRSITIRYKKQQDLGEINLEKTMVAVKKLKSEASTDEYKDLASELKIIIHLGENKHIVNLLGACTIGGGDLMVILEYCPHGNLLTFLRARREIFQPAWYKYATDMEKELTYIDLLMICHQAAKGMEFLQSKKCVHRDIAARNILVGNDFIIKVGDFGLARDISGDDLYLKNTSGLLPVKWMAPESLFDKLYTTMSDVWAFGILLWEVFSLGGSPYPGLPTEDLFSFLEDGKRMDRPDACPKEMFEIMMACWERNPYARPMFSQIEERISNCMRSNVHNENGDCHDGFPPKPTDDYLMANDDSRKENDYLIANEMSNGVYVPPEDQFSKSPKKGKTFVPSTSSVPDDYEHDYDPVDLPLIPKTQKGSYDEMTAAADYLDPTDGNDYLDPVDTHPTIV